MESPIGEGVWLIRCLLSAWFHCQLHGFISGACEIVGHCVGSGPLKASRSPKESIAFLAENISVFKQLVSAFRYAIPIEDLVEVGVILRNELRRYAEQNMHWSVVFSDAIQVRVCLLLGTGKSFAGPCLVDDASSLRSTPRAASVSLTIKLQLLGIVPDALRLDGE